MNDIVWKVIQISSASIVIIGGIITFLLLPKERLPNGGWDVAIPGGAFQITAIILVAGLGFTFVFSTMVRREKEVSMKVFLFTILYIICFGLVYLFLRSFRG
ncbi:hypothetical protein [Aquisalibacillus elongatus]|uniref:DUF1648 domain-containing protein n=1 Tax=Aquisalibacillus elongatus TaxID=485577 RepID=A0A3N5B3F1_9BACI|nr:hypothetical protein [Aquisalibacillus elongatus]RPF50080.1 hypothetical protein EDC24_2897 [Aquisalibacillus elongatus]